MCENNMLISIIIPVYNASHYINRCIDSILRQAVCEDDYEIICIDDNSNDNSREIIEEYVSSHSNIKLICHNQNRQQGAARNTGLNAAKGKYIWFVDIDDYITDNILSWIYERDIFSGEVDIFQFNSISERLDGSMFHEDYLEYPLNMSGLDLLKYEKDNNYRNRVKATWSKWYRCDFLKKNSLYFKEGVYWEDVCHTLNCFIHADKVRYEPIIGYIYVQTENSDMRGKQNWKKFADSIRFCIDCTTIIDKYVTEIDLQQFLLQPLGKTLAKYKLILHDLERNDLLSISNSLSEMELPILQKYFNQDLYSWLSNKNSLLLEWSK